MVAVDARRLVGAKIPGAAWAVAVAHDAVSAPGLNLFFASHTDPQAISAGPDVVETGRRNVGGAPIFDWQFSGIGPVPVIAGGKTATVPILAPQTDLFAGLNVGVAICNGEDARTVADWMAFHHKHHGMDAALVIDRRPNEDLSGELADLVAGLDLTRVVVLQPDFPLGRVGISAEAHPFNAPDAPGKDRMKVAPEDIWRAPIGEASIYELLKDLFLGRARAVANIDPFDLVLPGTVRVFDAAVASDSGMIALAGRRCYPWRVRKNQPAVFGDHICVQFDQAGGPRRWCLAPGKIAPDANWRYVRIAGANATPTATVPFMRFMALRHRDSPISKLVPKSSLIEDPLLLKLAATDFGHRPVRMPELKKPKINADDCKTAIVTTMKNEGPFLLEWLAYHRMIGVEDFLIYTNDCSDGTDSFLQLLHDRGMVQHRENGFQKTGMKPQHWALKAAAKEPVISDADWVICMDVDEYINIKIGEGTLTDLYAHMGDANMISCTWRLFGNADIDRFADQPVIEQFDRCAAELTRKPHQAWGFKTLFRNVGIFKKLGVHRPKGLNPQLWDQIRWVNGSGKSLPSTMYRNAWRSTQATYGYDAVTLNHYAVRSVDSFLVKRDRGRVNHVDRDQGLEYWFRMNNNTEQETSIQRMLPGLEKELQALLADPEIAAAHAASVAAHRRKIAELKQVRENDEFFDKLASARMQRLSRMHQYFGAKVFLAGPGIIPDDVAMAEHPVNFLFGLTDVKTDAT